MSAVSLEQYEALKADLASIQTSLDAVSQRSKLTAERLSLALYELDALAHDVAEFKARKPEHVPPPRCR